MALSVCIGVSLHVHKYIQYFAHNELVKQNYTKQSYKYDDCGKYLISLHSLI